MISTLSNPGSCAPLRLGAAISAAMRHPQSWSHRCNLSPKYFGNPKLFPINHLIWAQRTKRYKGHILQNSSRIIQRLSKSAYRVLLLWQLLLLQYCIYCMFSFLVIYYSPSCFDFDSLYSVILKKVWQMLLSSCSTSLHCHLVSCSLKSPSQAHLESFESTYITYIHFPLLAEQNNWDNHRSMTT